MDDVQAPGGTDEDYDTDCILLQGSSGSFSFSADVIFTLHRNLSNSALIKPNLSCCDVTHRRFHVRHRSDTCGGLSFCALAAS